MSVDVTLYAQFLLQTKLRVSLAGTLHTGLHELQQRHADDKAINKQQGFEQQAHT